ncbi:MAG TPA: RNA polymerase subunit sigma [Verrucomicrobiales bacterium]|nr:RNA polymerase subunit sigma [Roseibacillus sp.]HCQ34187.1 RNA polymerase subunit sigma [Verrucomicrobiales bacterium]
MSQLTSDSSLRVYLRDISKTELLTPEEEAELAERVGQGDAEAREHMIRANLRLVVKIAQDYANNGMALVDLIAEGNIGLMTAVDRFDPDRGAKFSTYSAWWINQSIKRALSNQSKTIRLPAHMVDKIARLRRISAILTEELGREPSSEELSEELGIPAHKLSRLKRASQRPTSLDAPVNDGEGINFGEIIGDDKAVHPLEALEEKTLRGQLSGLLEVLDEREQRIIDARYGLDGNRPLKLEEVGGEFGVTRERIRQLQAKALGKMRRALHRIEKPIPDPVRSAMGRKLPVAS